MQTAPWRHSLVMSHISVRSVVRSTIYGASHCNSSLLQQQVSKPLRNWFGCLTLKHAMPSLGRLAYGWEQVLHQCTTEQGVLMCYIAPGELLGTSLTLHSLPMGCCKFEGADLQDILIHRMQQPCWGPSLPVEKTGQAAFTGMLQHAAAHACGTEKHTQSLQWTQDFCGKPATW